MLSFRAFTLLVWFVGSLSQTALAEDSNWSHRYPPPVKIAPLVRPDVQQASHIDTVSTDNSTVEQTQWVDADIPPVPSDHLSYDVSKLPYGTPPHRTIEAPSTRNTSRKQPSHYSGNNASGHHPSGISTTPNHGYTNQKLTAPASASHGNSVHGNPVHGPLLPTLPGVENDPISAGPGRVGLGTHWIQRYPQHLPSIPGATVAPNWKTPYSYGHFGAEGKRHWTRQHGYRDRYLQWTLR